MDNITRRLTSNFIWLFISDALFRGTIFIGTLYLARVLGVAEFGLFSFAIAISTYLWLVVDLGINQYGTREVAQKVEKADELFRVLNSLRIVVSVIIFASFFLVISLADLPLHTRNVLIASGLYIFTYAISPDWVLRGIEKMKYLAIGNIIMSIFFLISIIFFVKDSGDTTIAAFLWSMAFLIGSITMVFFMWRSLDIRFFLTFSISKWRGHVKESIYFALIGSSFRLFMNIPILLLGFFVGADELGIFSAPQRLVITLISFNFVVPKAFFPVLSSLHGEPGSFMKASNNFQRIMVALGIPIAVGGTVLAKDMINLLYGSSYIEGSNMLKILIWQVPIAYMMLSYGNSLLALGYQKLFAILVGIGVLITIILNLVLIYIYGTHGAAFAMLVGGVLILLILTYIFSTRAYKSNPFNIYFLKVCIACALMVVVIKTIDVNILIKLTIGALSYAVIGVALGVIDRKAIVHSYFAMIRNKHSG